MARQAFIATWPGPADLRPEDLLLPEARAEDWAWVESQVVRVRLKAPVGPLIDGPAAAVQFAHGLDLQRDRENLIVLGLNARGLIQGHDVVAVGTLTATLVHPREFLKPLILMGAHACICIHNHPSGDETPSEEDRALAERLGAACRLMGIPLVDSLVFVDSGRWARVE